MSWIIAGVLLYGISLITASLIPQATKAIDEITTSLPKLRQKQQQDILECLEDECNPRLLSNLEVHTYELEYIYNNTNDTSIQGHVTIDFTLKEPTNQLIYHAKRMLELGEPFLYENGIHRLVTIRKYPPHDYVSLRLISNDSIFTPGQYKLQQRFVVSLIDGHVGFYQSLYIDGDGSIGYRETFSMEDCRVLSLCSSGNY